jgi:hypothetical protein
MARNPKQIIVFRREADVFITLQIAKTAQGGVKKINVVCEDTDVYVLIQLLFYNGKTKC